jgi:hypothetical protein
MFEAKRITAEKEAIKKRAVKHKRILWWKKALSLIHLNKS